MKWILMFVLFSQSVFACPVEPHEFMVNRLKSMTTQPGENLSGITEETFLSVYNRLKDHYVPKFQSEFGLEVDYVLHWESNWFNAQTGWGGPKKIRFFFSGELARGKYMTPDALLLIGCHEIGHHLGGLPKNEGKWSTSEAGADYYGALKCMRELLKNDPENDREYDLPEAVISKCRETYGAGDEFHICLRTTKAGEDMARAFQWGATKKEPGAMLLVDLPAVEVTNTSYPTRACRAETIFQGSLCNKPVEAALSFTNEHEGYCHEKNGDTQGMRPACWYKPVLE